MDSIDVTDSLKYKMYYKVSDTYQYLVPHGLQTFTQYYFKSRYEDDTQKVWTVPDNFAVKVEAPKGSSDLAIRYFDLPFPIKELKFFGIFSTLYPTTNDGENSWDMSGYLDLTSLVMKCFYGGEPVILLPQENAPENRLYLTSKIGPHGYTTFQGVPIKADYYNATCEAFFFK